MTEPTREQVDHNYALALAIIDGLQRDNAELLAALKQVEAEMRGGFGSSFGETREQVRRAIQSAEGRRP